jgi:hypothetical protein
MNISSVRDINTALLSGIWILIARMKLSMLLEVGGVLVEGSSLGMFLLARSAFLGLSS